MPVDFQTEEEIIMNLDLYMDPVHFDAEINRRMVEDMAADKYRLTVDNYRAELERMWMIVERIEEEYEELIK